VIADVFLAGVAASRRREQATGYVRRFLSKRKVGTTTCERVGTNLTPPNRVPAINSLPFDLTKPEGIRSKARDATVFV